MSNPEILNIDYFKGEISSCSMKFNGVITNGGPTFTQELRNLKKVLNSIDLGE